MLFLLTSTIAYETIVLKLFYLHISSSKLEFELYDVTMQDLAKKIQIVDYNYDLNYCRLTIRLNLLEN